MGIVERLGLDFGPAGKVGFLVSGGGWGRAISLGEEEEWEGLRVVETVGKCKRVLKRLNKV